MKTAIWLALSLIAIIQIITFSSIFTPNEVMSQYAILLALCLSLYTGISIRE
jgi:Sec-independent protein secretion pathway component TatC